jgi:hypothetical protein
MLLWSVLILTQEGFSAHSEKLSARLTVWIGRTCNLPIESAVRQVVFAVRSTKRSNRVRHWGHSIHDSSPRDSSDIP